MKVNDHYAVQSNPYNDMDKRMDYLLFGDDDRSVNEQVNPDKNLFPAGLRSEIISYRTAHTCNAMPISSASLLIFMQSRTSQ